MIYEKWALLVLLILALPFVLLVAYLSHRKKASGELDLIGMPAVSHTPLNPEGAVLVRGELWQARSVDGIPLQPDVRLRVVGQVKHLLLVETQ